MDRCVSEINLVQQAILLKPVPESGVSHSSKDWAPYEGRIKILTERFRGRDDRVVQSEVVQVLHTEINTPAIAEIFRHLRIHQNVIKCRARELVTRGIDGGVRNTLVPQPLDGKVELPFVPGFNFEVAFGSATDGLKYFFMNYFLIIKNFYLRPIGHLYFCLKLSIFNFQLSTLV